MFYFLLFVVELHFTKSAEMIPAENSAAAIKKNSMMAGTSPEKKRKE